MKAFAEVGNYRTWFEYGHFSLISRWDGQEFVHNIWQHLLLMTCMAGCQLCLMNMTSLSADGPNIFLFLRLYVEMAITQLPISFHALLIMENWLCSFPCWVFGKAVADVEKAVVEALEKQYSDVLASLKDTMAIKKFGLKYVQKLAKHGPIGPYAVPDEVSNPTHLKGLFGLARTSAEVLLA